MLLSGVGGSDRPCSVLIWPTANRLPMAFDAVSAVSKTFWDRNIDAPATALAAGLSGDEAIIDEEQLIVGVPNNLQPSHGRVLAVIARTGEGDKALTPAEWRPSHQSSLPGAPAPTPLSRCDSLTAWPGEARQASRNTLDRKCVESRRCRGDGRAVDPHARRWCYRCACRRRCPRALCAVPRC